MIETFARAMVFCGTRGASLPMNRFIVFTMDHRSHPESAISGRFVPGIPAANHRIGVILHTWEMGLLDASDWKAIWIEPDLREDPKKSEPAPMLRRDFKVNGPIARARAYVTSHGLYEMHLNGRRVGDEVFTPGWTSYNKRLQYQTYDVTDLIKSGDNAVGVLLGDGWYRGVIGWVSQRNFYGEKLAIATSDQGHAQGWP